MTKKQLMREIMQNICFPVSETLEPNKEYIYIIMNVHESNIYVNMYQGTPGGDYFLDFPEITLSSL